MNEEKTRLVAGKEAMLGEVESTIAALTSSNDALKRRNAELEATVSDLETELRKVCVLACAVLMLSLK